MHVFKNNADAESPACRDFVWSLFQSTLLGRLQSGGVTIHWHASSQQGSDRAGDQR